MEHIRVVLVDGLVTLRFRLTAGIASVRGHHYVRQAQHGNIGCDTSGWLSRVFTLCPQLTDLNLLIVKSPRIATLDIKLNAPSQALVNVGSGMMSCGFGTNVWCTCCGLGRVAGLGRNKRNFIKCWQCRETISLSLLCLLSYQK